MHWVLVRAERSRISHVEGILAIKVWLTRDIMVQLNSLSSTLRAIHGIPIQWVSIDWGCYRVILVSKVLVMLRVDGEESNGVVTHGVVV